MSLDTLFCSIPFTDAVSLPMAPAICKSIALKANKTSATLDLNIEFRDFILGHKHSSHIITFLKDGVLDAVVKDDVLGMFERMCQRILEHRPNLVGLSVFTYDCQITAKYLSWMLKRARPDIKIILGGSGLFSNLASTTTEADRWMKDGLIDFYIKGDAEESLYNYLRHGKNAQPMAWKQLSNEEIKLLPVPDYDDYRFELYKNQTLPVLGSRGCVRKCTFCDIHVHWKKFTWRTGKDVFDEMVYLSNKHDIHTFYFRDSLVNGNQKEYRTLVKLLADYNNTHEKKIQWMSFFIFRSAASMNERDWELTAQSGAKNLQVGIESLNSDIRHELGKNFNNDDLEFGIQQAKKHNIKLTFLFLIGYITETEQDIQNAIQWWKDHRDYKDIIEVNLGSPLGILDNTPLAKNFAELGLRKVGPTQQDWANENSDPKTRVRWYKELSSTLAELGFDEIKPFDNHYIMERMSQ